MDSEEKALAALRAGDFAGAAGLLKSIVAAKAYASPVLNNAYTIALHKAGSKDELAEASLQIGRHLQRKDRAAAMDYFQRALFSGVSAEEVRKIGKWHEEIAAPRPSTGTSGPQIRRDRIAHVVGCLLPGHAPSLYVQLLSKALEDRGVKSTVFTTEWAANWFFNPPGVRQSQPIEIAAKTIIAGIDGDFEERAERIASAISASGIDIVFYHNSSAEQITTRVAALWPAPLQVNVNHGDEVAADLFSGCVHLFENGLQRTAFPSRKRQHIPLISDIEQRLSSCTSSTRISLGVDTAQTVSGTFGNLYKVSETGYLQAVARILTRFPRHFHIFAGSGDRAPIQEFFRKEKLLPQVVFLGHMPDVAPLLDCIDVYLNSFPHSGGQSVLEPMAAGKPVVVRRYPVLTHLNVGSELVADTALIAGTDDDYFRIAERLIENPELRRTYGESLRGRFQANFTPSHLAGQYLDFMESLAE